MLVISQPQRRDQAKVLALQCVPNARIEALDNVLDAILTAARRPPDLLVLDHAIDGAAAPALITNLVRVAPRTKVLVFDELADEPGAQPLNSAVKPWSEAEAALRHWASTRVDAAGARG